MIGDGLVVRLLGFLACLAAFFFAACSSPELPQEIEAQALTRPNVVFILTDDLDYASAQRMPGLGSLLVEEGASFEKAFASYPLCCPSRATILTGLYAHNHSVRTNRPPDGGFEKFRAEGHEEDNIAVRLQGEGGYRTAFFGKYLNEYGADPTHVPPGWDEWHGKLEEQKLYDYGINENGRVVSYGSAPEDFFTDVLSGQATNFVRRAASEDQPFFAYIAPTAPHGPATPAERHRGAFAGEVAPRPPSFDEEDVSDKPPWVENAARITEGEISGLDALYSKRLESMLAVDDMLVLLVEELEAAGELDDTFIFFTSDNGFLLGEHRVKTAKNRPYEESVQVPLFVRGPGVTPGSQPEKLALNTDLAPTFADLAGIDFEADGRSLAPLLRGEDPPWRSAVLLEGFAKEKKDGASKSEAKGKGTRFGPSFAPYTAIRTETHKYVEYENGETELYDLTTDPYELESAHESADPSLVEDLQTRLDALRSCANADCQESEGVASLPGSSREWGVGVFYAPLSAALLNPGRLPTPG